MTSVERVCACCSREQVEAVALSLEGELAALDLQHAELLQRAAQQRGQQHAEHSSGADREATAHVTAGVLDAMRRKGRQIQTLRQYMRSLSNGM